MRLKPLRGESGSRLSLNWRHNVPVLAVIGVPRSLHTIEQAAIQAALRGHDVVFVDIPSALANIPSRFPVWRRLAVEHLTPEATATALAAFSPPFVLSFSELHLVLAAQVRALLDLPGSSVAVEERVRDKSCTRLRLAENGLSHAAWAIATLADLSDVVQQFTVPYIIKPVDLTGSVGLRGIRSCDEAASYWTLFREPSQEIGRERRLLVEEFIEGREYSVEGICLDGHFHLLAETRKYTSGFPSFFEIGHLLPDPVAKADPRIATYIQQVVTALQIDTAPIHAEIMVSPDSIELIEIHTRFGGDLIPLLMDHAFDLNVFGLWYGALISRIAPRPPQAHRLCGIWFLEEWQLRSGLRLPPSPPGVEYQVIIGNSHAGNAKAESLDNITIVNRRIGHVLFDADSHESAEQFVALLDHDRREVH